MSKAKIALGAFLILVGVLLLLRCGGETTGPGSTALEPAAQMLAYTDCKAFAPRPTIYYVSSDVDCVSYQYDGQSTLHITRTDAAFNCCPDSFTVSVAAEGAVITLTEVEWLTTPCRCLCLYDMEYQVVDVPPGSVTLRFVEPYTESEDDPLELTIDLVANPAGSLCVTRDHYPWALE